MAKNKIESLSINIETYSSTDLLKCGVYKYSESPNFDILLFEYSINGGEIKTVDLACGELLLEKIMDALTDETVTKWAFNAQFERVCLSAWLRENYPDKFRSYSILQDTVGDYLDLVFWKCFHI